MNASRLSPSILGVLLIVATAIAGAAGDSLAQAIAADPSVTAPSGVYGFSGARSGDNDPQGVIGECIWIFDRSNQAQVARGNCPTDAPGEFRVALHPGKYVVHGPGGTRTIEVKPGQWVKVISIVALPISF